MYIGFLLFSMIIELISPSTIKISGEALEHSYWISVGLRFTFSCAIYGILSLFVNFFQMVKFFVDVYKEYKSKKSVDFIA